MRTSRIPLDSGMMILQSWTQTGLHCVSIGLVTFIPTVVNPPFIRQPLTGKRISTPKESRPVTFISPRMVSIDVTLVRGVTYPRKKLTTKWRS
jgi:hypothetical protein